VRRVRRALHFVAHALASDLFQAARPMERPQHPTDVEDRAQLSRALQFQRKTDDYLVLNRDEVRALKRVLGE
jgi:hypothetical protein